MKNKIFKIICIVSVGVFLGGCDNVDTVKNISEKEDNVEVTHNTEADITADYESEIMNHEITTDTQNSFTNSLLNNGTIGGTIESNALKNE